MLIIAITILWLVPQIEGRDILCGKDSFLVPQEEYYQYASSKYKISEIQQPGQTQLTQKLTDIKNTFDTDRTTSASKSTLTSLEYSPTYPFLGQTPNIVESTVQDIPTTCKRLDAILPHYPTTYDEDIGYADLVTKTAQTTIPIATEFDHNYVTSNGKLLLAYQDDQTEETTKLTGMLFYNPKLDKVEEQTLTDKKTIACLSYYNIHDDKEFHNFWTFRQHEIGSSITQIITLIKDITIDTPGNDNKTLTISFKDLPDLNEFHTKIMFWDKFFKIKSIFYKPDLLMGSSHELNSMLKHFLTKLENSKTTWVGNILCKGLKLTCAFALAHTSQTHVTLNSVQDLANQKITTYKIFPLADKDGKIYNDLYLHQVGNKAVSSEEPISKLGCISTPMGDICKTMFPHHLNGDCGNAVTQGIVLTSGVSPCMKTELEGVLVYPFTCNEDSLHVTVVTSKTLDLLIKCRDNSDLYSLQIKPGNTELPSGCDIIVDHKLVFSGTFTPKNSDYRKIIEPFFHGTSYNTLNKIAKEIGDQSILSIGGIILGGVSLALFLLWVGITTFQTKSFCWKPLTDNQTTRTNNTTQRQEEREPFQDPTRVSIELIGNRTNGNRAFGRGPPPYRTSVIGNIT